jgi:translocation protein SEC62
MGKVSFWLLPNLTEDVGFFESFRPIYQCDINSKAPKPSNEASTSTSPVVEADMPNPEGDDGATRGELENVEELGAKDEEAAEEEELGEMDEEVEEEDEEDDAVLGNDVEDDAGGKLTGDGSENEEEGRKSGSSSNDNGYEMVEAEDAEIVSEDVRPTIRQRRGKKKGDKPRLT